MPVTIQKAYRLAPETIETIEHYRRLWSQAKPLSGASVINEAMKRLREAESNKQELKRKEKRA